MIRPRMPFGKHKFQLIEDLPDDYVVWLHESANLRQPLKTHVQDEYRKRFESDVVVATVDVSAERLKQLRRKLALRFHPDRGGSTAEMRVVNVVFDELAGVAS